MCCSSAGRRRRRFTDAKADGAAAVAAALAGLAAPPPPPNPAAQPAATALALGAVAPAADAAALAARAQAAVLFKSAVLPASAPAAALLGGFGLVPKSKLWEERSVCLFVCSFALLSLCFCFRSPTNHASSDHMIYNNNKTSDKRMARPMPCNSRPLSLPLPQPVL